MDKLQKEIYGNTLEMIKVTTDSERLRLYETIKDTYETGDRLDQARALSDLNQNDIAMYEKNIGLLESRGIKSVDDSVVRGRGSDAMENVLGQKLKILKTGLDVFKEDAVILKQTIDDYEMYQECGYTPDETFNMLKRIF